MHKAKLEPCVELNLSEQELKTVIQKSKDWAIMNGELLLNFSEKFKFSRISLLFLFLLFYV